MYNHLLINKQVIKTTEIQVGGFFCLPQYAIVIKNIFSLLNLFFMKYKVFGFSSLSKRGKTSFGAECRSFFIGELLVESNTIVGTIQNYDGIWNINGEISNEKMVLVFGDNDKRRPLQTYKGAKFDFKISNPFLFGSATGTIEYPENYPEQFEISGGSPLISQGEPEPLKLYYEKNHDVVYIAFVEEKF